MCNMSFLKEGLSWFGFLSKGVVLKLQVRFSKSKSSDLACLKVWIRSREKSNYQECEDVDRISARLSDSHAKSLCSCDKSSTGRF
jgi:hypothetical protein